MNQNPYAAPQPPPPHDPYRTGVPLRGEPQPWDIGDVLRGAWEIFKGCWGPLTAAVLVMVVLGAMPGQVPNVLVQSGALEAGTSSYYGVLVPFTFLGWLVQQFFSAGITRMTLDAGRAGAAPFSQLFSAGGPGRFGPFLVMMVLKTIVIGLGFVVFIVPGVVLALGLSLSSYYVIDQRLGPIEAMKASWEATCGHKANLLLFYFVGGLVLVGGALACCVGYLPAIAVIMVANAIIYLRLSGTAAGPGTGGGMPAWTGLGGPPPGGGPVGGGFGPPPGYGPPR